MSEFSLPQPTSRRHRSPVAKALFAQRDVLWALMLHDIKSRFFGNGWGYVVTIIWPATHIAIIVAFYVIARRPVPYGSSGFLYASTGILPYIAWSYMSRFTMTGVMQNRSFMSYPIIKMLDMIAARLALESVSVFIITVGLFCVAELLQVDAVPLSLSTAVGGLLSAVFLGIGFGVLNSVIVRIFPLWIIGYMGIVILFWFTAGLAINPEALPAVLGYWVSWNPLMHSVEWIRLGYYADFPAHLLDKGYVLSVGGRNVGFGSHPREGTSAVL